MHGLLIDHYKGGGYYPRGGPETIPRRMIRVIEKGGGKVMVRAPVSEILMDERGRACGVCVKGLHVFAPTVISAVGAPNTYKKLLPEDFRHKVLLLSFSLRNQIPQQMRWPCALFALRLWHCACVFFCVLATSLLASRAPVRCPVLAARIMLPRT